MSIERPKAAETVYKLKLVDVLMGQGMHGIDAIRQIGATEASFERERAIAARGFRSEAGQADPEGGRTGRLLSPSHIAKALTGGCKMNC